MLIFSMSRWHCGICELFAYFPCSQRAQIQASPPRPCHVFFSSKSATKLCFSMCACGSVCVFMDINLVHLQVQASFSQLQNSPTHPCTLNYFEKKNLNGGARGKGSTPILLGAGKSGEVQPLGENTWRFRMGKLPCLHACYKHFQKCTSINIAKKTLRNSIYTYTDWKDYRPEKY